MQATSLSKARKQVRRGIVFLNKHGPKNWRRFINTSILLMQHRYNCMLGQLYTDAVIGMAILHLSPRDAQRYGLDSSDSVAYSHLTQAWKEILGEVLA